MTSRERAAFAAGIETVVDIAQRAAERLRPKAAERPIRFEMAIEALEAIVEAGRASIATAGTAEAEQPRPAE